MTTENEWWSSLTGDDLTTNAFGLPHYDVNAVADFIAPYLQSGIILDIGCGPGRLGHTLAKRIPECTFVGYDVSPLMVAQAQINAPLNWTAHLSNGTDIPELDGVASAYSVTVFQHLPSYVVSGYLQQISNILLSGGNCVFTYAVGTEDAFLSHQVSHEEMSQWVLDAGMTPLRLLTPVEHPAWHWMKATK